MTALPRTHRQLDGTPTGSWDEDGFHLFFDTDEEQYDLRVSDVETARALLKAVEDLYDWVAEHDRERAAYDRATPEEITRVIRDEEALAEGDWAETAREQADYSRKAEKENR